MRVLPKSKRHRIALFYATLAWVGLVSGVVGGMLAERSALSWLLPILGLAGYTLCARVAMLLWQGRRTTPRPPRARYVVAAATLALGTFHAQAQQASENPSRTNPRSGFARDNPPGCPVPASPGLAGSARQALGRTDIFGWTNRRPLVGSAALSEAP
jgi:hypothetical protein